MRLIDLLDPFDRSLDWLRIRFCVITGRVAGSQVYRHDRGHDAAERMSYYLQGELAVEADPAERATLLRSMAACELTMDRAHGPLPGSSGRERSEGHWVAGQALSVLAEVEDCVATYRQVDWRAFPAFGAAWDVANRMVATPDLHARHAMLADFYAAVLDHMGAEAAEVVANLPGPGCPPLPPYVPPADRATATV